MPEPLPDPPSQPQSQVEGGLPKYECWFCDTEWEGFSALLAHMETGKCVMRNKIHDLAFESPEYGFYGNRRTDKFAFFCFECKVQFTQISELFYHVERTAACSYLLQDDQCLGCLRDFYIEYYDCPGTDSMGY
ncbi:unnamed protein product [Penicillium olsonii]|nr:unnamed protein product [Penicillium olsonii]CAG7931072.1 unnamed protein product [Penicillium olsonii]